MALLYVKEYETLGNDNKSAAQVPMEPGVAEQTPVTFTTATQSAALNDATKIVMLQSDADCHILFSVNPTATVNHEKLIAGIKYYRGVPKASGFKVSVIAAT